MTWAPDYLTSAELKAYLRIGDTDDDAQIAVAITAASRAIDDHCNRQFGKVATTEQRVYRADYDYERRRWRVDVDDLQSSAGLVVTVDGSAVTDYALEPRNAVAKGKAWTRIVFGEGFTLVDNDVTAVGPWGWTAFPVAVTLACRLQSSRFMARRDSPFGVAGSPDAGNELRLLSRVDPDVAVSLRDYRRPRKVG